MPARGCCTYSVCMYIVLVCGNTMCLSQLWLSDVQGRKKNLLRATCISIVAKWDYGSGRTIIRQLVSQLSLSESMVQGEPWGVFHMISIIYEVSNLTHLHIVHFLMFMKKLEDLDSNGTSMTSVDPEELILTWKIAWSTVGVPVMINITDCKISKILNMTMFRFKDFSGVGWGESITKP